MGDGTYLACTKCRKAVNYFKYNSSYVGADVGQTDSDEIISFLLNHKSHDGFISLKLVTYQDYLDNYLDD